MLKISFVLRGSNLAFGRATASLLLTIFSFLLSTGCTRFDLLNATIPSCDYLRTTDLPYGDHARQKLDVYRPRNAAPGTPVVVFFYGGDWQYGRRDDYRFVGEALSSRGFIAVLPDYRLYPEVTFPAFVEDSDRAVRWVHDNAARLGGDKARIYIMGHSAGAHIAALLTLDPHYLRNVGLDENNIRATAALSGPYDFIPPQSDRPVFGKPTTQSAMDPHKPINFVHASAPPMLLFQGLKDDIVEPANAV